jgi:tetratricopeptide (TPR) repeat protein
LAARIDLSTLLRSVSPKEASEVLDGAPAAQKQDPAYIVERNWVLMASNNRLELQKDLDSALAKSRTPDLLYQDALLRYDQRDFVRCRAALDEILKQQPENMTAVDLVAKTYAAQGDSARALTVVQGYVAQRPKSPYLLSLLGIWQIKEHHSDAARQAFSSAIAANPDYIPARLALSDVDAAAGNLDEAKGTLREILSKQPSNNQAKVRLAQIENLSGDQTASRNDFTAVLNAEPNNRAALSGLAYVLAEGHPDDALRYAQHAVELAPEDATAQDTLGWVYYRKNLYDSALSYFKTAVAKQPTAEHQYHLALAYSKLGDKHLADVNLNAALQQDPKLRMPEPVSR